jgi:dTDP-4-amino-4,6-dideoxygalactose transaminase
MKIALLIPSMPTAEEIFPWLKKIDAATWYSNFGPLNHEFEQAILKFFTAADSLHMTTVANNTVGLELSLQALKLPPTAKVLIPAFTFIATATAVTRVGLTPLFADMDAESWLLTPAIARAALKKYSFQAVMPVTTLGCPQDTQAWDQFSEETGIPVIIDAAGAFDNQTTVGKRSQVVLSFHATKTMGVGEGGGVISSDAKFIHNLRTLSNFGVDPKGTGHVVYQAGTNAKLSEYHAAVGLAALERWPQQKQLRMHLLRYYQKKLQAFKNQIVFQAGSHDLVHSIFSVRLLTKTDITPVAEYLASKGIATRRWYYPPIHQQPFYRNAESAGPLETTAAITKQLIGLPFHTRLTEAEIDYIVEQIAETL